MPIKYPNGQIKNNLYEQVLENENAIKDLLSANVVLNEFGIKVVKVSTAEPTPEDLEDLDYGDAWLVGNTTPYVVYIVTRKVEGGLLTKQWVNIGQFPLAGPKGEPGVQGEIGPQGPAGPSGLQGIQGPQGVQGPQGIQGIKGDTGLQGPQGERGKALHVEAVFSSETLIPNPVTEDDLAKGYLIGTSAPYHFWGYVGSLTSYQKVDFGQFTGSQGEQGPVGPQGPKGDTGAQGVQGIQGEQGPQGPQGVAGTAGKDGVLLKYTVTINNNNPMFTITDTKISANSNVFMIVSTNRIEIETSHTVRINNVNYTVYLADAGYNISTIGTGIQEASFVPYNNYICVLDTTNNRCFISGARQMASLYEFNRKVPTKYKHNIVVSNISDLNSGGKIGFQIISTDPTEITTKALLTQALVDNSNDIEEGGTPLPATNINEILDSNIHASIIITNIYTSSIDGSITVSGVFVGSDLNPECGWWTTKLTNSISIIDTVEITY